MRWKGSNFGQLFQWVIVKHCRQGGRRYQKSEKCNCWRLLWAFPMYAALKWQSRLLSPYLEIMINSSRYVSLENKRYEGKQKPASFTHQSTFMFWKEAARDCCAKFKFEVKNSAYLVFITRIPKSYALGPTLDLGARCTSVQWNEWVPTVRESAASEGFLNHLEKKSKRKVVRKSIWYWWLWEKVTWFSNLSLP